MATIEEHADIDGTRVLSHVLHERYRADLVPLLVGIALSIGVCAPLVWNGQLLLLDWVNGPHTISIRDGLLGVNGGLTTGALQTVIVGFGTTLLGNAAQWIPLVAFFPLATVAISRLVGGSIWSRVGAGLLYAVNPFVFSRIYVGQFGLLIGYALLPFAVGCAWRAFAHRGIRRFGPVLWWAALTGISPHFFWIYGLALLAVVLTRSDFGWQSLWWVAGALSAFAVLSAYIILPNSATTLPIHVGLNDLAVYRTAGDIHLGLFGNVLGLYGFWRIGPGPTLPKSVVGGWMVLLLAILLVVGLGVVSVLRQRAATSSPEDTRRNGACLLILGVGGFFLALGNQGPTGFAFSWAYRHVPFFDVMREPEKFSMLLALAYAVFFGWGIQELDRQRVSSSAKLTSIGLTAVAIGLPLGYTPTIFNGLSAQIAPSSIPNTWNAVESLVGHQSGNVLFLPWHLYLSFPFTNGRPISNPAPSYFAADVISGDNAEVDGTESDSSSERSAYLEHLFARGTELSSFGSLVAPLGVRFVVLAKHDDWNNYEWLSSQVDLRMVLQNRDFEVWMNKSYAGLVQHVGALGHVESNDALIRTVDSRHFSAIGLRTKPNARASQSSNITDFDGIKISPVAYSSSASSGWLAVATAYQKGWSLDGNHAIESAEGTVLVRAGGPSKTLSFNPWRSARLGYFISGAGFFGLALSILIARRKRANS